MMQLPSSRFCVERPTIPDAFGRVALALAGSANEQASRR
jgi:hypothetical protein